MRPVKIEVQRLLGERQHPKAHAGIARRPRERDAGRRAQPVSFSALVLTHVRTSLLGSIAKS